jgi:hypothetical protein
MDSKRDIFWSARHVAFVLMSDISTSGDRSRPIATALVPKCNVPQTNIFSALCRANYFGPRVIPITKEEPIVVHRCVRVILIPFYLIGELP